MQSQISTRSQFPLGAFSWSTPAYYAPLQLLVSADTSGSIKAFDIENETVVWSFDCGSRVTTSPRIETNCHKQDIVLLGAESGDFYCLCARTGKVEWQKKLGSCIRATAAVSSNFSDGIQRLYIGVYGARMLCIDVLNGDLLWSRYLPKHEFFGGTKRGVVSSPLIADVDMDGELEVVTGMRSRRMFCLSAATGKIKWFREFKYDPDSSPSFFIVQGEPRVFVGGGEHTAGDGDNALLCLRGTDGKVVWVARGHGGMDSCPVIDDLNGDNDPEVVITSLADASCYAFCATTGRKVWQRPFGPTDDCSHDENNICIKPGNVYFTEDAVCRSYTTPLVLQDTDGNRIVGVGSNNGTVQFLNGRDGEALQCFSFKGMVRGSLIGFSTAKGEQLIAGACGRSLILFNAPGYKSQWPSFKGGSCHTGALMPLDTSVISTRAPGQRFLWFKLIWYWMIVDAFRFATFKFERIFLRPFGIRILPYYY